MLFDRLKELKSKEMTIGVTFSQFDLLHSGHIAMLADAKTFCDYLIVGLQNDASSDRPEKNKPVQSIIERQIQVAAVRYVDEVIVYNTEKDLEELLLILPIDVRILGNEYSNRDFTGKDICTRLGIRLMYNKRNHSFSSTTLRERVALASASQR